jgi:CRISPR-associated protein (TIGR02710 family)
VFEMKALIISVGTGTKPSKQTVDSLAKALAQSVDRHRPDKVLFVTTKESEEVTLPTILRNIKNYNYEKIKIENPDNIQQIYETLQPKIRQIREESNHLVIDYTSGTKAMTAALAMLATIYEANELSYISGKRANGIVQPGTEQIISIRPYFATAEQKIKTAIQFFNKAQYEAAMSILNQIQKTIRDPVIINRTTPLLNLAKAYALWDKFQHQKAFKTLKEIDMPELAQNKQFLGQIVNRLIQNKEPEPYLIADLISNAERKGNEQQKYDDAVARLYRTMELMAQYKLKTQYGINPSKAETSKIPEELLKKWNIASETETIKLSLERDYELLKALGDKLGEKYEEDKELKNLLSKRNTSILAHGLEPVNKQTYRHLRIKTLEYAENTVKNLKQHLENAKFAKWKI